MSKINKAFLSLCLLISCAGSFRAQMTPTASPAPPPKEAPPLSTEIIDYFKGSWSGNGKLVKSGKTIESDFTFTDDAENKSLVVRQKEHPPNDYQYVALWSTDNISGEIVMMMTDGSARLLRSGGSGWQNNKIIFQSTPQLRAAFALEKITFERISPASFKTTYEMSRDDGKTWRTGDEQTFTKK